MIMKCRFFKRDMESANVPAHLSVAARAHIAACSRCAAHWQEQAGLRNLLCEIDEVTLPANFDERIYARLAMQRESFTQSSRFATYAKQLRSTIWRQAFTPLAASCASLVVAALMAYVAMQSDSSTEHNFAVTPKLNEVAQVNSSRSDIHNGQTSFTEKQLASNESAPRNLPMPKRNSLRELPDAREPRAAAQARNQGANRSLRINKELNSHQEDRHEENSARARILVAATPSSMTVTRRRPTGESEAFLIHAVSFGSQPLTPAARFVAGSTEREQGIW